jgi:hypothetical protein
MPYQMLNYFFKNISMCWSMGFKPAVPALRRKRQENCEVEARPSYTSDTLFQKKKERKGN